MPAIHVPFRSATTPSGASPPPRRGASAARFSWGATVSLNPGGWRLSRSPQGSGRGWRTPGSRSRIPWSLPPPAIRGRVRRPTTPRSGSPGSHPPESCPGSLWGAIGRQGLAAGRPGRSLRDRAACPRTRGSRCPRRCGRRPPPATHGRGHTATTPAACCRRSRSWASVGRFLMDATAGAGRSGHAPGSSRIRMCAKFIATLRRRAHQGRTVRRSARCWPPPHWRGAALP